MNQNSKSSVTFGQWLKAQRKKSFITQKTLAEQISCSPIMIRKLEANERHASKQLAILLAEVFGIAPSSHDVFIEFACTGKTTQPVLLIEIDRLSNLESKQKRFSSIHPHALIQSSSAYLVDTQKDHTLLVIQGQERFPIASITKILTAIIAIEQASLLQWFTIKQEILDIIRAYRGHSASLVTNDKLQLKDLLYAMMLPSGDDAAFTIAKELCGSMPEFVKIMNHYAQKLKMKQTYFVNPSGTSYLTALDHSPASWNVSSAADLINLTLYAMDNPLFAQIVQSHRYILQANSQHHHYEWETRNALLAEYAGLTGVKTGYTAEAGSCMVFSATNGSKQLMGVTLRGQYAEQHFIDAKALLDWGFAQ